MKDGSLGSLELKIFQRLKRSSEAAQLKAIAQLNFSSADEGYFLESTMLYNLKTVRAIVKYIPMEAGCGNEKSNLKIYKVFPISNQEYSQYLTTNSSYKLFSRFPCGVDQITIWFNDFGFGIIKDL